MAEFLRPDFALQRFVEWVRAKFDIALKVEQLKDLKADQVRELLLEQTSAKYRRREIEYPVEFAMSMAYGGPAANVYGFQALADWANAKYNAGLSAERIQDAKPRDLHEQLLKLSEAYNNGKLDEEVSEKTAHLNRTELVQWANQRFHASLREEDLADGEEAKNRLAEVGREYLRAELADLEQYVLLNVYDSTWKDHLYMMDRLKDEIWTRSLAEKDPKIEYKREGFRMFNEMLESIDDRVTDIIFRVHSGGRGPGQERLAREPDFARRSGPVRGGRGAAGGRSSPARRGQGQADPAGATQGRPQRSVPVRQRQKI